MIRMKLACVLLVVGTAVFSSVGHLHGSEAEFNGRSYFEVATELAREDIVARYRMLNEIQAAGEEALPLLTWLGEHENPAVRRVTAYLTGRLDSARADVLLGTLLRDSDEAVRGHAFDGLARRPEANSVVLSDYLKQTPLPPACVGRFGPVSPGFGAPRIVWSPDGRRILALVPGGLFEMGFPDAPSGLTRIGASPVSHRAAALFWPAGGATLFSTESSFRNGWLYRWLRKHGRGFEAQGFGEVRNAECVADSPPGAIVTVRGTTVVRQGVAADSDRPLFRLPDSAHPLALCDGGARVLCLDRSGLRILGAEGFDVLLTDDFVFTDDAAVTGASFSPRAALVSAVAGSRIRTWLAGSGEELWRREVDAYMQCPRWAPDGIRLAIITQEVVQVLNSATGEGIRSFYDPINPAGELAWSPDGRYLCVSGRGLLTVWDCFSSRPTMEVSEAPSGSDPVSFEAALAERWEELASPDAKVASRAEESLVAVGEAVLPFLRGLIPVLDESDRAGAVELLERGPSDGRRYDASEEARLRLLAGAIGPELAAALRSPTLPEAARRQLSAIEIGSRAGRLDTRLLRGVSVVARIGSAEALSFLAEVGAGLPDGALTGYARAVRRAVER